MAFVDFGDRFGVLPRSYIDEDPMFASAFFGNLASIGMPAGYHHLYEYGTCGVFAALGRPTLEAGFADQRPHPAPHDEGLLDLRRAHRGRSDLLVRPEAVQADPGGPGGGRPVRR